MINNKGVSVISLVITIIVLIIVTSITAFTGIRIVDQSRRTQAVKRLEAVASAVIAHEKELGYADTLSSNSEGGFMQIGVDDYKTMGLPNFANTDEHAPILIRKTVDSVDSTKKIYELKTPKLIKKTGVYTDDDYVTYQREYFDKDVVEHYKVEFDEAKGVNRPILTEQMVPIKSYLDSNNDPNPVLVEDMYKSDWYNYSVDSPMWANVMIKDSDNIMYVWIPRFAYHIQELYYAKDYLSIPQTAVQIIFLRGTSDLMPNEEVLPKGYQVHPAFQYKDEDGNKVDLPGFWVAKENIDFANHVVTNSGVVATTEIELSNLHPNMDPNEVDSHLIKNTEWAAIAYLSMYSVGRSENGNSLIDSASGVLDLNERCFVAGGLKSKIQDKIPYADMYYLNKKDPESDEPNSYDTVTYDSYEGYSGDKYGHSQGRKFGDGIVATSSGLHDKSAWFGGTSIRVSSTQPYIIRGEDSNLFSYSAFNDSASTTDPGAMYRNVLVIKDR